MVDTKTENMKFVKAAFGDQRFEKFVVCHMPAEFKALLISFNKGIDGSEYLHCFLILITNN